MKSTTMQSTRARVRSPAIPLTAGRTVPVKLWAWVGVGILSFQLYVVGRWVTGPYFVPTPPGPDPISAGQQLYFTCLQWGVSLAAIACLLQWVVMPRIRTGRVSADGRLFMAGIMVVFWDMSMNYSSTALLYNSHLINYGAWTLGSWPTWFSPAGNLLPEPVFVTIPGYTALVTTQAIFVCWLMRKAKTRWPRLGILSRLILILIGCAVVDTLIEISLLRTGVYAYPGAIRSFALFPGRTYEFPLNEGIFFGGLSVGSMAALHYFRNDKGETIVERGIDTLRISAGARQWVRGFAVFGFCHLAFIVFYAVPMQFFSLHSDAFPEGYPSYMLNGMCVYGVNHDQCPGPGVMIPRLDTDATN